MSDVFIVIYVTQRTPLAGQESGDNCIVTESGDFIVTENNDFIVWLINV